MCIYTRPHMFLIPSILIGVCHMLRTLFPLQVSGHFVFLFVLFYCCFVCPFATGGFTACPHARAGPVTYVLYVCVCMHVWMYLCDHAVHKRMYISMKVRMYVENALYLCIHALVHASTPFPLHDGLHQLAVCIRFSTETILHIYIHIYKYIT